MSIVIAGIFPFLEDWIDNPQPPQLTGVINELDNILPKASDFLGLLPLPTDGVEPCKSGKRRRTEGPVSGLQTVNKRDLLGGLFKTVFSLVTCVIDGTNKIKGGVIKGTTDAVKGLQNDLKPMIDALNEIGGNQPDPSAPNSNQPSSTEMESSSSSCTLNTISNCHIACTATVTTTIGRARKREDSEACTTVCDSPVTKCGATGVTSTSTITSTTAAIQRCAKGCSRCNTPRQPPDPISGVDYLTRTNGPAYVSAPTISALSTDAELFRRNITPRETSTPRHNLDKRALSNPRGTESGDVEKWLLEMIKQPGSKQLEHAQEKSDWFTTSITEQLEDSRGSWNLVGMHGCTAVIVVSRKRIFMAHLWEYPTMLNVDGHFQRDAIDVLSNPDGDGKGVAQGLRAFTGPGGDFENIADNNVRAMISK
jgi:hypothetical protein